ncbi:MAG: hypothetical protein M3441_19020 [Chloroflexota bacterium]|nr:hypothetical protein [Chloroflexota bacterium]
MANPFAITAAANSLRLDAKQQAQTSFTVYNSSGRAIRGRARIVAQNPTSETWITLVGDAEKDFPIAGTHQYNVEIVVPYGSSPGSYPFRLDMVGTENPDEEFSQGPSVTFEVPVAPPPKKPFPIWIPIAIVVAALVLVGGVIAFLATRGGGTTPPDATATATLTSTPVESTSTPTPSSTAAPAASQVWSHPASILSNRTYYHMRLTGPGLIRARATWSGSQGDLSLIINGPGQTGFYAREDGPSTLEVAYTVTPEDFAAGDSWRLTVGSFGAGSAEGNIQITYPSGSPTSPVQDNFVVSPNSGKAVNLLVLRGPGPIEAETTWSGTPNSLALIVNGPGQVNAYARQDGGSPLSVNYVVTPADFAAGANWRVSVVSFSAGSQLEGNIQMTFP